MKQTFNIPQPFDGHLHLRDGIQMQAVLPHSEMQFWGGVIMPNLKPSVTKVGMALEYRERILSACPAGSDFFPYMALYLTDNTTEADIVLAAKHRDVIAGFKLYPAGATTNSADGVTDIRSAKFYEKLKLMESLGIPLMIHGEVTDSDVDIFDREKIFIERYLTDIVEFVPKSKIVLEHITTEEGVEFVKSCGKNVVATITAHHLTINRNAILAGGIRPHHYCLPVAKREKHRLALLEAATSGNPKFFLGTDSAPHERYAKESACGCAGCFTALTAMELYAEAFEQSEHEDWVGRLERFASVYGPEFYGLEPSEKIATFVREDWVVPKMLPFDPSIIIEESDSGQSDQGNAPTKKPVVIPFRAGETLHWRLKE